MIRFLVEKSLVYLAGVLGLFELHDRIEALTAQTDLILRDADGLASRLETLEKRVEFLHGSWD